MVKFKFTGWLVFLGLMWTACSPISAPANTPVKLGATMATPAPITPGQPSATPAPLPDATSADPSVKAIALLAKLAGLKTEETRVSKMEHQDWPDACLGVPEVGEVCSAVITPGYYFELSNGDQVYWLRTNQDVSDGRIAGPLNTLIGTRVRLKAATILGVPALELKVASLESVEWPNSCLGINTPGIMCLDVISPGYKVVLTDKTGQVVLHTNRDATSVVLEKSK